MTAIVGIYCGGGVVIGTDSSATFVAGSVRTIEQPTSRKLEIIAGEVMLAGTGTIGHNQRFSNIVTRFFEKVPSKISHYLQIGKRLSSDAIKDFKETPMPGTPAYPYGALVGFPYKDKVYLCEFAEGNMQPEFKDDAIWYVSMGSGQQITDPFLAFIRNVFWGDNLPSIQDAIFAATWALQHAIEVNPGGINEPIRIGVLERTSSNSAKFSARLLEDIDLEEHKNYISSSKKALREHAEFLKKRIDVSEVHKLPTPPKS